MFQYYLKAAGLALSWVGTGRLVFSLNFSEADFEAVAERFLAAAEAMLADGWFETGALATDRTIKRRILREMLSHTLGRSRSSGPRASRSLMIMSERGRSHGRHKKILENDAFISLPRLSGEVAR